MKQIALLSIIILRIAAIDLYSQDINYQDLALSQGIDHTFSNTFKPLTANSNWPCQYGETFGDNSATVTFVV